MTNFEQFQKMSVKDLAYFLYEHCLGCPEGSEWCGGDPTKMDCHSCWIKWLEREMTERWVGLFRK